MSWRINAERVVVLGWPAAVLAQFAHPLVAAGVAAHSRAINNPRQRLSRTRHTIAAMLALTFGTRAEAAAAAAGIRTIHDSVHGELLTGAGSFPAGTPYSAHDPALLRWVHATLMETLPRAYELYVGPLPPGDRARFCQEGLLMVAALGMPEGLLPGSVAELHAYINEMLNSGTIAVGPTAQALKETLLAWPYGRLLYLPAVGLLPPAIRRAYGLHWAWWQEVLLRLSGWLVRSVLPWVPSSWRYWPVARLAAQRDMLEPERQHTPAQPKLMSGDVESWMARSKN